MAVRAKAKRGASLRKTTDIGSRSLRYHQECKNNRRTHAWRAAPSVKFLSGDHDSAVVAQIDHRVGQCLERVVQLTDAFKAQQQAAKLVFPGELTLNGAKALFEDCRIEAALATAL